MAGQYLFQAFKGQRELQYTVTDMRTTLTFASAWS
jgi:hypothetical protein